MNGLALSPAASMLNVAVAGLPGGQLAKQVQDKQDEIRRRKKLQASQSLSPAGQSLLNLGGLTL